MNQTVQTYSINTYQPVPKKLDVLTTEYEATVKSYIAKYGVRWIYNKKIIDTSNNEASSDSTTPAPKRRKRNILYHWYIDYNCHRGGTKRNKAFTNLTGQQRDTQKLSKKTNCTARLKVTCYKSNPGMVVLETVNDHNHVVGAAEDLQFLPLSDEARTYIETRLNEGYRKRDTRISIQKNYRAYLRNLAVDSSVGVNSILHRDQMVHADEIYNIYKKIQENYYKRANDQKESVKFWLNELAEKGYKTFVGDHYESNFTFGFSSPWQQQLLLQASSICLDATHCVTSIEKAILYTIVIRHPLTGTGCPVAYMFTEDHAMYPIKEFLLFVRLRIGLQSIRKITIDVSSTEYSAIQAVYPQSTVQWCLFHVARAWMSKIRVLVKLSSSSQNAQVHKSMITSLKSMMWEKSTDEFTRKLGKFLSTYAIYPEFINYFKTKYLDGDKFIQWAAAFQPLTYTNMETNNFIESWHNQLKSTYLERKRNRRADRLIYILVNDVETDYIANTNRIQLNIGRMGPEERRKRRREIAAESINEEVISMLVEEVEDEEVNNIIRYKVLSFTSDGLSYNIDVTDEQMKSCTCPDFTWNNIACKHMYLLKRYKNSLLVFFSTTSLPTPEVHIPNQSSTSIEEIPVPSVDFKTTITSLQTAMNNSFNTYLQNPHHITDSQIQSLQDMQNAISIILNNNNNNRPNNESLQTQRR